MATSEDDHADSKSGLFRPLVLLVISLGGLTVFTAVNADRLCVNLAGLCGRQSSALRIPLPSLAPEPAKPAIDVPVLTDDPVSADPAIDDQASAEAPNAVPTGTFAAQFANIADPTAEARPSPARIARQIPARLQDVTFDLGAGANAASTIEVRKTVRVNGADVGALTVRIDESARLYANGSQLSALLPPDSVKPAAAADQFLSFDQLRSAGVNIRYDPTQDKLMISDK